MMPPDDRTPVEKASNPSGTRIGLHHPFQSLKPFSRDVEPGSRPNESPGVRSFLTRNLFSQRMLVTALCLCRPVPGR